MNACIAILLSAGCANCYFSLVATIFDKLKQMSAYQVPGIDEVDSHGRAHCAQADFGYVIYSFVIHHGLGVNL